MNKIRVTIDSDLSDIIPRFLENRNKDVVSIKEALKKNDFSAIEVIGHKMKGSSGGYGIEQLSLIGARLESDSKSQNADGLQKALAELEDFLSRLEIVFQ